jgi:SAM-dependent methyltransferase
MSDIDFEEVGRQLRKPEGEFGKAIGREMNNSNETLYDLALSMTQIKDNESILEIGFGNGKFFDKYIKANYSVALTGVDFSALMCSEAKENNKSLVFSGKLNIINSPFEDADIPPGSIDKIFTFNTIYFWEDVPRFLKKIKTVLKPGGYFILGYRPRSFMKDLPFTRQVFTMYESPEINKILTENGFKVISEKTNEYKKEAMNTEMTFTDIITIAGIA